MEPILRCFGLLLKVVAFFVMPLVRLYNHVHYAPIRIPAPDDDLLQLAAVDLAAKICNREVTAVAAVRAYVTRIRLVDPLLNAVVEDRFEAALVEAGRMDATIAASGVRPLELLQRYPLCGVPFTVKESCSLKGRAKGTVAVVVCGSRLRVKVWRTPWLNRHTYTHTHTHCYSAPSVLICVVILRTGYRQSTEPTSPQ